MSPRTKLFSSLTIAGALAVWLAGCGGTTPAGKSTPTGPAAGTEHAGKHAKEGGVASSDGYTVDVLKRPERAEPNSNTTLAFAIRNPQGELVKELAIVHTKPVHLIVIRKDLSGFQHVHPAVDATSGVVTMNDLQFPAAGEYRLFVDLTPAGGKNVVLTHDLIVGNASEYQPEPVTADSSFTKTFDGTRVSLTTAPATLRAGQESTLNFALTDEHSNQPVTDLEPYLGAPGHSVILRAETLDFLHAHPAEMPGMTGEHAGHNRLPLHSKREKTWPPKRNLLTNLRAHLPLRRQR